MEPKELNNFPKVTKTIVGLYCVCCFCLLSFDNFKAIFFWRLLPHRFNSAHLWALDRGDSHPCQFFFFFFFEAGEGGHMN